MVQKPRGRPSPNWAEFRGYQSPNYTMVPDELFDEHLAFLSGAELKVLLYVIRRTFGFKKDSDSISLSQMLHGIVTHEGKVLDRGVGLSKPTLLQALRSLVDEKGLIVRERRRSADRGDEASVYKLRLAGDSAPMQRPIPPVVKKFNQGAGKETSPGPWAKNLTTQETGLQDTDKQDTDPSNIRRSSPSTIEWSEAASTDGPVLTDLTKPEPRANRPTPERTAPDLVDGPRTGFSSVGQVIHSSSLKRASTGRTRSQKRYSEERQIILAMVQDFAVEFGDEAPLASSVSRAHNLWEQSGIPIEAFTAFMYEARALTKESSANVKKQRKATPEQASIWGPGKNRMPYFFATLESIAERYGKGRE